VNDGRQPVALLAVTRAIREHEVMADDQRRLDLAVGDSFGAHEK
jgi:hypothetical protein